MKFKIGDNVSYIVKDYSRVYTVYGKITDINHKVDFAWIQSKKNPELSHYKPIDYLTLISITRKLK